MKVICKTCGSENTDPGGDVSFLRCGKCGNPTLVRIPQEEDKTGRIAASGVGAAIGAGVGGPFGAVVGAILGFIVGEAADKNINRENKK